MKANMSMEVRPAGKVTVVRAEQRSKAWLPMEVRVAGKVTEASEEQDEAGGEGDGGEGGAVGEGAGGDEGEALRHSGVPPRVD